MLGLTAPSQAPICSCNSKRAMQSPRPGHPFLLPAASSWAHHSKRQRRTKNPICVTASAIPAALAAATNGEPPAHLSCMASNLCTQTTSGALEKSVASPVQVPHGQSCHRLAADCLAVGACLARLSRAPGCSLSLTLQFSCTAGTDVCHLLGALFAASMPSPAAWPWRLPAQHAILGLPLKQGVALCQLLHRGFPRAPSPAFNYRQPAALWPVLWS